LDTTLELILALSSEQVAGPRTPGKARRNPALRFATGARSARRPKSVGSPRIRTRVRGSVPTGQVLRPIQSQCRTLPTLCRRPTSGTASRSIGAWRRNAWGGASRA